MEHVDSGDPVGQQCSIHVAVRNADGFAGRCRGTHAIEEISKKKVGIG